MGHCLYQGKNVAIPIEYIYRAICNFYYTSVAAQLTEQCTTCITSNADAIT